MPRLDHHRKPFDEGTLAKLDLFRRTAEGFLGVFIGSRQDRCKSIHIYDFFCGPGVDSEGRPGSPVLLLQHLKGLQHIIEAQAYDVEVYLNDAEADKVSELKGHLHALNLESGPYRLRFAERVFLEVFEEEVQKMSSSANLVLIDQNGVNQFPPAVFAKLRSIPRTDFLVFMSSSYAWRFQDAPEMQRHVETTKVFSPELAFYDTHRAFVDYYRTLVPVGEHYFLAPFSIKKGSNIYGVMFGSSNPKGLEKFLEAAWKLDGQRGESNFDIDREGMFSLPGDLPIEWGKVSKVVEFERELQLAILNRTLATTTDVYLSALERGFLPRHANSVLKQMQKERKIAKMAGVGSFSLRSPINITTLV